MAKTAKQWRDESREQAKHHPNRYLSGYPDFVMVGEGTVEMTQADYDKLGEYSHTVPTGVYLGKCWKSVYGDERFLRWYGWNDGKDKTQVLIHSRRIKVVTEAQRIASAELQRLDKEVMHV